MFYFKEGGLKQINEIWVKWYLCFVQSISMDRHHERVNFLDDVVKIKFIDWKIKLSFQYLSANLPQNLLIFLHIFFTFEM